ncbi:MAG: transporter transrane region [Candidatus Eremiobacteraeota bacterium]|nr:transporter transrane region [Candidatus Eremiobacteraeota bacterium]
MLKHPMLKNARVVLDLTKGERPLLIASVAIALVMSALYFTLPPLAKPILHAFIDGTPSEKQHALGQLVVALAVLNVVQAILGSAQSYLLSVAGEGVTRRLRRLLFRKLIALPMAAINQMRAGDIASRWSNDVGIVQALATTNVVNLVRFAAQLVVAIGVMFFLQWQLTLEAIAAMAIVIVTANFAMKYLSTSSVRLQGLRANALAVAAEAVANALLVKMAVRQDYVTQRVDEKLGETYDLAKRRALVQATVIPVVNTVALVMFGAILLLEAQRVIAGTVSMAELGAYVVSVGLLATAAGQLAITLNSVRQSLAGLSRVFAIMRMPSEAAHPGDACAPAGDIALEGVSMRYGSEGEFAVDGVTLTIPRGSSFALVGPSGSGKSTLLSLLGGVFEATSGTITIGGRDLRTLDLDAHRERIGYVSQEPFAFQASLRENLLLAKPDATEDELLRALRAANAQHIVERLANGLDSEIGEGGKTLSRGERQRIAVARLFLSDPEIVLLDEPTASLDAQNEMLVKVALDEILVGRTTILVTHRTRMVRECDAIGVLLDGRLVEVGTYDELCAAGGVFATLDRLQAGEGMLPDPAFTTTLEELHAPVH